MIFISHNIYEVLSVMFNIVSGYEKSHRDSREEFAALAAAAVKEPVSTHIVRSRSPSGKVRYLAVDRNAAPREDGIVLIVTRSGFKVCRYRDGIPLKYVWGTVVWYMQQG
jgi:hypothetical protein